MNLEAPLFAVLLEASFQQYCAHHKVGPTGWRRGMYGTIEAVYDTTSFSVSKKAEAIFRSN